MTVNPFRIESHTQATAEARLRFLSAVPSRERAREGSKLFYAGAVRQWIEVRKRPEGGLHLLFYKECPCQ